MSADAPRPGCGVAELLALRARTHGDAEFIVTDQESFTFSAALGRAASVAEALGELGVGEGNRVAILTANAPEYVWLLLALGLIGAVGVPLNTAARGAQLLHLLKDAAPALLVTDGSAPLGDLPDELGLCAADLAELARRPPASPARVHGAGNARDPSKLFLLMYTSGTTGPPKGVMCPQSHPLSVGRDVAELFGVSDRDRIYCCLPLFHATAMWWDVFAALWAGATIVLRARFSASRFWSEVATTRATRFSAMMSMGSILLDRPPVHAEREHAARVSWIAPLPPSPSAWERRFGLQVCTDYAMTELHPISALAPGDTIDPRPGYAGALCDADDVLIADVDGTELPPEHSGEIVVRPRTPGTHFAGYWGGTPFDGTFRTGDIGYLSDGKLFVTGRTADAIRRRGENISCWEVEQILRSDPRIRDAAVFGLPSALGEQDVACFVVPADPKVREEDLVARAASNMAYFMVPRYWRAVDKLPVNHAYKVDKARVRELALSSPESLWDSEAAGVDVRALSRGR